MSIFYQYRCKCNFVWDGDAEGRVCPSCEAVVPEGSGQAFFATAPHEVDPINPPHYTRHPSGIECIQVTEHMSFTLGNAIKYIWRADLKNGEEDLRKAIWYIEREIQRRNKKEGVN